jgi:hypothetical protein
MRRVINNRRLLRFGLALVAITAAGSGVYAGGPLLLGNNFQPVTWQKTEVRGGPLNTQTVDANGVVQYRVDSGPLGPLSNAQAVALADRIFDTYNAIPTSTIRFHNAGPILDPSTGSPVDVNGSNVGKFIGNNPTFQNCIIFDGDGTITNDPTVLGFFGFLQADLNSNTLQEAYVVLNGQTLTGRNAISTTSFLGVFMHEFGHFCGPLDHEQSSGAFADDRSGIAPPPGFSAGQAYDLFAPFTETLYPFLYSAPSGSQLGVQFPDSGYFIATLDMDTINAVSSLYPTPDFQASTGSIEGQVLVQAGSDQVPVSGMNIVARRIDQGPYPPAPGVTAFLGSPSLDSEGVPQAPPPLAATDCLATVSSAVTGLQFGNGTYKIQGLPPGNYLVSLQQIDQGAVQGSGIGPLATQAVLPVSQEFFNGASNSSDSVNVITPVTVTAGQTASGINFLINGLSGAALTPIAANGINDRKKKAQAITLGSEVTGTVSDGDSGQLVINLGQGQTELVSNLYKFTVTSTQIFFITLDGIPDARDTTGADIDLYLWSSGVGKKHTSLSDPSLISYSNGPTIDELVAVQLPPGTYFIGVASAQGTESYKLRLIPSQ